MKDLVQDVFTLVKSMSSKVVDDKHDLDPAVTELREKACDDIQLILLRYIAQLQILKEIKWD